MNTAHLLISELCIVITILTFRTSWLCSASTLVTTNLLPSSFAVNQMPNGQFILYVLQQQFTTYEHNTSMHYNNGMYSESSSYTQLHSGYVPATVCKLNNITLMLDHNNAHAAITTMKPHAIDCRVLEQCWLRTQPPRMLVEGGKCMD